MDIYTVSFFGHRCLDSPLQIERQLEKLVLELLSEKRRFKYETAVWLTALI